MCVCGRPNIPGQRPANIYLIYISNPFSDIVEGLGIGDVIDQHDAHGTSVVGSGDCVESLLPCRVPAMSKQFIKCQKY